MEQANLDSYSGRLFADHGPTSGAVRELLLLRSLCYGNVCPVASEAPIRSQGTKARD